MISYIFTPSSYGLGIFVDATNNYVLTKNSNLQTNFVLCQGTISSFIFKLFKFISLYSKTRQTM